MESADVEAIMRQKLEVITKELCVMESLKCFKMKIDAVATNGGNYLGELYEITITGKSTLGFKRLDLFVKIKTNVPDSFLVSVNHAYANEHHSYKTVLKLFSEIQSTAEVKEQDKFKTVKYYPNSNSDFVVMENMNANGYSVLLDRREPVTEDYAEAAIRKLADFHALSFALETLRPNFYEKHVKSVQTAFKFDLFQIFLRNTIDFVLDWIDDKNSRKRIQKIAHEAVEDLSRLMSKGSNKVACLTHGDYRNNNLLVHKDNCDGKLQMIVVDYQLINYGPPLIDFIYFIYLCTDEKLRRTHMKTLKETYYDELKSFLKYFNIDVQDKYPRQVFEDDFKSLHMKYGLIVGLAIGPYFTLTPDGLATDLTREDFYDTRPVKHPLAVERVNGVVNNFIEWGFI